MFDVGFSELVLLAVIGLLVLGPQRLPKIAAEVGRWAGRARRTLADFRYQLEREVDLDKPAEPPRPKLRVVASGDRSQRATKPTDAPSGSR
jgi:sec-independent protein translocase protein TatB